MYFGLLVSMVLHATLLGWTVVSIQSTPELTAPVIEPIAVEMITPSELTRLTRGSRTATLKEARAKESTETEATPKETSRPRPPVAQPPPPPPPAPPEPAPQKPAEAPAPPPPPPAAAPPPPAPEPDRAALEQKLADLALQEAVEAKRQAEAKAKAEADAKAKAEADAKARAEAEAAKAKAEAEAKARAEAEAKRKADEKRKADLKRKQDEKRREEARQKRIADEKAKAQFNADRLAALLDKSPDPRAPAPAAPEPSTDTRAKGPVLGAREGNDATLSASKAGWLASLLSRAVSQCWNVPAGIVGLENVVVRLEVRLNRDGTLVATPKVTNSDSFPAFGLVADSAVRAMIACAPYSLPPDMYEGGWEHIVFAFRPPQ